MYISDFKLVDILRAKMGEQEARTLVEYIAVRIEDNYVEAQKVFATKEDLLKLELKIAECIHKNARETQKLISDSRAETASIFAESKAETAKMFADSNIEIQKQFLEVQKQFTEVQKSIAESKSELLKWLIGFILGSTVAVIGTILSVMKMGG